MPIDYRARLSANTDDSLYARFGANAKRKKFWDKVNFKHQRQQRYGSSLRSALKLANSVIQEKRDRGITFLRQRMQDDYSGRGAYRRRSHRRL